MRCKKAEERSWLCSKTDPSSNPGSPVSSCVTLGLHLAPWLTDSSCSVNRHVSSSPHLPPKLELCCLTNASGKCSVWEGESNTLESGRVKQ
jgi:hypothetical protein